ncbi:HalOD1 output domain-containing protein [Halobellus marinus]|jgi:hypothetical protein|uniref:HalOD1 output domain-containing protein n=1 Tax=Halobellus TaxID=1073986 RepID=UPI0028A77248|nr:HalOD1 output domain-containing protein [Halobellus sp. DFY28]
MIKRRSNIDQGRKTGWKTVAQHDFGGLTELDATIATALGEDGCLEDGPLYHAVDVESAEQFLASADDASVVFPVSGHSVRVSADGTVEIRQESGDALGVRPVEH